MHGARRVSVLLMAGILLAAWRVSAMSFAVTNEAAANAFTPAVPDGVARVDYASGVDGAGDWALAWPPATGHAWVVVLHGHGADGAQLYTRADIREHWLKPLRAAGLGVLTVNLRGNAWMSPPAAADLHDLLGWLRKHHGADRFLFISGSMGGTGNLTYATLHPEDCAAVVALGTSTDLAAYCGWCLSHTNGILPEIGQAMLRAYGGPPDELPELYRRHSPLFNAERLTMPVFVAHGEQDALMPVTQARALAAKLKGRPTFTYVEVPGGNHDSPLFCREAIDWLLKQAHEPAL
jgi:pimeloyl-ACP methyl ester carboxylesterase